MIDIQVKIHDKFSVELKIGFFVRQDQKQEEFAVNTWLFIPNSLDINSDTYSKSLFYRDIKTNVRLITPIFLLREITGGQAIPLKNLESSFRNLAADTSRTQISEYEYQIKMFMAIVKSSSRDEIAHIINSPIASDIGHKCREYISNLEAISSSYRELDHIINVPTIPSDIINYYLFGDEFLSNVIEKYTFRLIGNIEARYGKEKYRDVIENLKNLISSEISYRATKDYPVVDTESPDKNRNLVFRQGILKKYIESDLFLNSNKKKDAALVEQLYLSLAAGISMIFATAIAFSFQQRYGNFTMPLFVALVVSYMLKDRIKDTMRYYFAHRLGTKYFDNKTIISIKEKQIGWIKDGVDFITDDKTPEEVLYIRSRTPLLQAENRINDEKIILYRKLVRIKNEDLKDQNDRYATAGINEIVRLHLSNLIKKTDNPQVPLSTIDSDGEIVNIRGDKIYYLNMIVQLQSSNQLDYKRFRIVFNRSGIIEIEEFR